LLAVAATACDSAGSEDDFNEAVPGGVIGTASLFTWSSDGERLYHTVDEDIVGEGGVISGAHYRIYETTPGDSPRLIVEDSTDADDFEPAVSDLEATGDALYFFVRSAEPLNTGRILRWSSGEADAEEIVDGAFDPQARVADLLSLSADGRYLAYYTGEGHRPDAFEIRVRDLDRGTDIYTEVVTSDYSGGARDIPLLLSREGSRLLYGFSASGNAPGDVLTVVDLASGEEQGVRLTGPNGRSGGSFYAQGVQFYANAEHFVAVYAVEGASAQDTVVAYQLPAGTPQPTGSLRREQNGWITSFSGSGAAPSYYAFWRAEYERDLCAVHVIDLSRGEERRVAAPISKEGLFSCYGSLAIAPGDRHIAYHSNETDVNRTLYVADMPR
jgi:hypothetical protein